MRALLLGTALLAIVGPALGEPVMVHDFSDPSVWRDNGDGGHAPEVTLDTEVQRAGGGLRLRYTNQAPDWGNLVAASSVPPDAVALTLWVYKHSADERAAMHVWLFEADGDAWLQQLRFDGRSLADAAPGWHEVRLPLGGFTFDGRGAKSRDMLSVDRMLLGCNFADLDVTVAQMSWDVQTNAQRLELPRTPDLVLEDGPRGRVGVLRLDGALPEGYRAAHDPAALAEAAREGGFGTTLLQAGDLADPAVLDPATLDVVVLPYGPNFPAGARDAFVAYLKGGGSFLSLGGYAFDSLVEFTTVGWVRMGMGLTAAQMADPVSAAPMNSRTGQPGDAMNFAPDQITVFDPHFRLAECTRVEPAGWYAEQAPEAGATFERPLEGYAASALTGLNSPVFPDVYRRWIPVLAGKGESGEDRGPVLALVHNFAGNYDGSSWGISGLTDSTDLLLGSAARRALLCGVLGELAGQVFLHELRTDWACYEPGEEARVSVEVSNRGRQAAGRTLVLRANGQVLAQRELALEPGARETVEVPVPTTAQTPDLVTVTAALVDGGRVVDQLETGFCVRSQAVLASGPRVGWSGNQMTVDGRATFMVGTNQTGMMYYSPTETPLQWDRDFADMAAHNFHILRILHFSPFSKGGYEGRPTNAVMDLRERPEKLVRQMDAIVQLAQKHRVTIFLALHDWLPVELSDEELAAQADWNRFWTERYRDVPGILYDVQNEPGVSTPEYPHVVELWNQWLQERYGSDEALAQAWWRRPPEAALPNVPIGAATEDWDDVRSADRKRFEAELLNRWVKANVDGARAGDPDALICVGYLPWMAPADKMLGTRHTDFSNMHFYGDAGGFATEFKLIDRRFDGKGMTLGECGAQESHDARTWGQDDLKTEASLRRFQTYLHYGLGLGGAFVCNWCWKEFDEMVFPWGLVQRNVPVPKPWLRTWEQGSMLLAGLGPAYESPQVLVLAPDQCRIGPHFDHLQNGVKRACELLMSQSVDFGVINEEDLDRLPASARALVWPFPYCPTDETFARVEAWVEAGGTLYVSGDVAFGPSRRPDRPGRRAALGLGEMAPADPFSTPDERWGMAPAETTVGAGRVLYVPYPLELRAQGTDAEVYARFLAFAGIRSHEVRAAGGGVRVMSAPTESGGRIYVLARTGGNGTLQRVVLPSETTDHQTPRPRADVELELGRDGFAFVVVGAQGQVVAAESQGVILIGGELLARAEGHFGLRALDDADLTASQRVLVLPHQCPSVEVPGLAVAQGGEAWRGELGQAAKTGGTREPAGRSLRFDDTAGQIGVLALRGELTTACEVVDRMRTLRW